MGIIEDRIAKQKAEADRRKAEQQMAAGGTPTTPMGISGIGGNEDQSKMAPFTKPAMPTIEPTTLQKAATQAETTKAAAPESTLATELGTKTFEEQTRDVAQEKAARFSEKMQTFGSLGERVENMVTGAFSGVTGTGETKNLAEGYTFDIGSVQEFINPNAKTQDIEKALQDFNALMVNATPQDAFNHFAKPEIQGLFKNPSAGIMEMVKAAYKTDANSLHGIVANLVSDNIIDPDQVNFQSLIDTGFVSFDDNGVISELGVTAEDLEEILGPQWKTMTPEQIGEEVEADRIDLLNNERKIREQLSDPNLPAQNRLALLDELKRMGAIGAVQAEQEAQEAQIEAADAGKIMVGGEIQDVNELLQDEEIRGDVMNYLTDPESSTNKAWREMNPEFATWLDREFESLKGNREALEKGLNDFTSIQRSNESFFNENLSSQGGRLDSDLMELFGFQGSGFQSTQSKTSDNPVYQMLSDLNSPEVTKRATDILNDLPEDQMEDLRNITDPNEIANLRKTLEMSPDKIPEFMDLLEIRKNWKSIGEGAGIDSMVDVVFGGKSGGRELNNAGDVRELMASLYTKAQFGDKRAEAQRNLLASVFDSDGDGHLDHSSKVRAAIDQLVAEEGNLSSLIGTGGVGDRLSEFRNLRDEEFQGEEESLYNKLKGSIGADDTIISNEDIASITSSFPMVGYDQESIDQGEALVKLLTRLSDSALQNKFQIDPKNISAKLIETHNQLASRKIDQAVNPAWFQNFDAPSVSENKNAIAETRAMMQRLENYKASGSPQLRNMALNKLKELKLKTTMPKKLEWNQVVRTSDELAEKLEFDRPIAGKEGMFRKKLNGKYRLAHVKRDGGYKPEVQDLIHKWATWRNFTDEAFNGESFRSALGEAQGKEALSPRDVGRKIVAASSKSKLRNFLKSLRGSR